jgi:hypothetical protein
MNSHIIIGIPNFSMLECQRPTEPWGKMKTAPLISIIFILLILSESMFYLDISTEIVCSSSTWNSEIDKEFIGNGSDFNNTRFIGADSDIKIQLSITSDWWSKTVDTVPPPREDAAIATNGKFIILFGGRGSGLFNDTWLYDFQNSSWTELFPSLSPSPRLGSAMTRIWNEDKIILFGGQQGTTLLSDTWSFNITNLEWSSINTTIHPSSRSYSLMSMINGTKKILLFGGYGGQSENYCDTWIFDSGSTSWDLIQTPTFPSGRYGATLAPILPDDKIMLFGGGGLPPFNETWIFDMSNTEWSQKIPPISPPARNVHSMAPIGNSGNMLLFGGSNQDFGYNDTWMYNSSENIWTEILTPNSPTRGIQYSMVSIENATEVMLIDSLSNLSWKFYLSSYCKSGEYYSPYHNAGNPSDFLSICWSASVPIGTSLKFQLRTANNIASLQTKMFVGYDNTTITYYEIPSSSIASTHYNDTIIQYKTLFRTSSPYLTPSLMKVDIFYDVIPGPPINVFPVHRSWINNSTPVFQWGFNDTDSISMRSYEWQMHKWTSESGWLEYSSGEKLSNDTKYIPIKAIDDGISYWRVRTQDIEGNWGPFSEYSEFGIDTAPPKPVSAQIIPNKWTSGNCTIYFSSEDVLSGIDNYTVFIDGTSIGPQISPFILPELSDGLHQINITASDKAGNSASANLRAYIDNGIPEPFLPEIEPAGWTNGSPRLLFQANDTGSGISHYRIEIDENGFFNATSPYQFEDIPDGIHNITIQAIDLAGNYRIESIQVYIDRIPPTNFIITISPEGWTNGNPTISFNATDGNSQLGHFEIDINGGGFYCQTSPVILNNLSEGDNIIKVRAFDNAGNFVEGQIPALIDKSPPEPFIPVSSEKNWTRNATAISFTTNDRISGVDHFEICIDNGPFTKAASIYQLPILTDGIHNITVKAFDRASNFIDGKITVYIDRTPPVWRSLKANWDTRDIDPEKVKLSLNAFDNLSGLDQMSFSNDGIHYSAWEPFSVNKTWKLSSDDGTRTVYIRIKDHAGNGATPRSIEFPSEPKNPFLVPLLLLVLLVVAITLLTRGRKREASQSSRTLTSSQASSAKKI